MRLVPILGGLLLVATVAACRRKADLLPMAEGPDVSVACRMDDEGRLLITVANAGKRFAKATTTQVEFASLPPIRLPTRPIPPGGAETLSYRVPEECFLPECRFRITADILDEVTETDESNNVAAGSCPKGPVSDRRF